MKNQQRGLMTVLLIVLLAGCGAYPADSTPQTTLNPLVDVNKTDSGWTLEGSMRNVHPSAVALHNVTVVAYSQQGDLVCEYEVGTLNVSQPQERLSTQCDGFPAVITGTANEQLCKGVVIIIIWVWEGTDRERESKYDDPSQWEDYNRECEGTLPPDRFIET